MCDVCEAAIRGNTPTPVEDMHKSQPPVRFTPTPVGDMSLSLSLINISTRNIPTPVGDMRKKSVSPK